MKLYNQFNNILNKKEKKYILIVIISIIFMGLLEMIGIGMVPTFLFGVMEPTKFLNYLPFFLRNNIEPIIIESTLVFFLSLVLFVFLIKNSFLLALNYLIINLRGNIREGIINRTNKFYNSVSYKDFLNYNSSNIIRNITTESQNTSSVLRDISLLFNEIVIVIFILTLNFLFNFKITLVTISILIFPSLIYYLFTKNILKKIGSENVEIRAKLIQTINHTIGSFKENLIQKKIPFLQNYFREILSNEISNTKKYNFFSVIPKIIFELVAITVIILTILILEIDEQTILKQLPNLSFFVVSLIKIMPSVSRISTNVTKIIYNLKSVEVVNTISKGLKNNKSIKRINLNNQIKDFNFLKKITFENVSFGYSKENKILKNLNFDIGKNQTVLLKGVSGTGKSTFIDLILGLIEPDIGKIKIDNEKIENVLEEWHKKISLLPQKVFLLEDTIKNNIIFGNDNSKYQDEKVNKLIKDVNLEALVNKFKNGIDTKVSELGKNLSGGELQRICLARSLYKNSEILICDEPTTGLDENNIDIISNILKNLSKQKTIILISHENKLEKICDVIFEIKNKEISIIKFKN